jgi:ribose transport system permease protein
MNSRRKEWFVRFQPLLALVVMVIALSLMAGSGKNMVGFWKSFLTVDNGFTVLRQISINACLSIGMTLVIISGGIDLSVGSLLAVSGVCAAGLLKNGIALPWAGVQLQFTPAGAILAAVAVGLVLGWHNGVVVTRLRVPPFVATLGMLGIARGLTMLSTGGQPIPNLGPVFAFIGAGFWLRVPTIVWICAALVGIFHVISRHTMLGRYIYAVGGSERAAAYAGLNVKRVKTWVYTLGGGLAGLAGVLQMARVGAATPNAGIGYELDSIAAVVIGGTSLSGGRGSILGTVLGCAIIGVLNSGLVHLGVPSDWQFVVKGYVTIAVVALDQLQSRRE